MLNQARGRTGKVKGSEADAGWKHWGLHTQEVYTDPCRRAALHAPCPGQPFAEPCAQMAEREIPGLLSRSFPVAGHGTVSGYLELHPPGASAPQGLPPSTGHQAWEKKALGNQGGITKAKLCSLVAGKGQMAVVEWINRKIHISPLLVQRHLRQNHGFVALLQEQNEVLVILHPEEQHKEPFPWVFSASVDQGCALGECQCLKIPAIPCFTSG